MTAGASHFGAGQFEAAESAWLHALSLARAFGQDDPRLATTHHHLGELYLMTDRTAEAQDHLEAALAIRGRTVGSDHPAVAETLWLLGVAASQRGSNQEATLYLERAGAIASETPSANPRTLGAIYAELGRLYAVQGRPGDAVSAYRRAIGLWETAAGSNPEGVIRALVGAARSEMVLARFESAESDLRRAGSIAKQSLPREHELQADVLSARVRLHLQRGQPERALPVAESAVAIREQVQGPDHVETALSRVELGHAQNSMKLHGEALESYRTALPAIEAKLGPMSPTACDALHGMAEAHLNLDRAADAEEPARRALRCRQQNHGPDHPLVGGSHLLIGGVYYWLGRPDDAVPEWERALEIFVRTDTLSDPGHVIVLANLGRVYLKLDEPAKAEIAYTQLVAQYARNPESGDEHLGMAWADLGVVYFSTGRPERARDAFRNALRILEPRLGRDAPAVVQVRRNLAASNRRLRRQKPAP